ncbi:MAG: hypothetical protein ORO03_03260 [Alphaproteobacteria bacterium]|nr:hypothetical protein [Alphaproteobacteria bacterium]
MHIAVVDIGSPKKGKIGWVIMDDKENFCCQGKSLGKFIDKIKAVIKKNEKIAIGFEAPLFVPKRMNEMELNCQREGEAGKSFSAGAGAAVLVTALTVIPFILSGIKEYNGQPDVFFDFEKWQTAKAGIFFFEAFVTSKPKPKGSSKSSDIDDAKIAAKTALCRFNQCKSHESDVTVGKDESLNLLGAMLLRCGFSQDVSLLDKSCIVIKCNKP